MAGASFDPDRFASLAAPLVQAQAHPGWWKRRFSRRTTA